MSDNSFETEVESKHQQMLRYLDAINLDDLHSEGLKISFGGKTFKFTDLEVMDDSSIEDRIKAEFKQKLNEQQQKIRDKINNKINQLLIMHQQKTQELDRKEQDLKRKYSKSAMMPEINYEHMKRGLSVVKGNSNDELMWVYRATYNPRYLIYYEIGERRNIKRRKPIPARLVSMMKTDILLLVTTKGKKITRVATKQLVETGGRGSIKDLIDFQHYHQTGSGDCWGNWKIPSEWSTPDDILKTAKEAEAILETINQGSLASRNPNSLPRIQTLIDSCSNVEEVQPSTVERENGNDNVDDVWQTI